MLSWKPCDGLVDLIIIIFPSGASLPGRHGAKAAGGTRRYNGRRARAPYLFIYFLISLFTCV